MEEKRKYKTNRKLMKFEELGSILREKRESRGASLRAIGRELGIDHYTISRAEKGECRMSLDIFEQIANYYGLTLCFTVLKEKPHPTHHEPSAEAAP